MLSQNLIIYFTFFSAATIPALLYMWQLPHFYGLAYWNKDDYARAGFKMLPSVDADGTKTYWAMTRASLGLAAWSYAVPALGFTSYMFAPTGLLIAGLQYYPVWKFGQFIGNSDAGNDAKRIHWGKWSFILSLASLPLMLLGMVVFGKGTDNQIRMLYVSFWL
jgi:heme O synthase-like polyprenyltransferase